MYQLDQPPAAYDLPELRPPERPGAGRRPPGRRAIVGLGAAAAAVALLAAVMLSGEETCTPAFDASLVLGCADGAPLPEAPLDLDVAVDLSVVRGDEPTAEAVAGRVAELAEPVLAHGGRLRVTGFTRSATRAARIFEARVPTVEQLRVARRKPMEQQVRTALSRALERVVRGGAPRALGTGSDPVGALLGLGRFERTPGAPLVGALITDGRVNTAQFNLDRALREDPRKAAARLSAMVRPYADAPAALAVIGLGRTGAVAEEDVDETEQLQAVWQRACRRLTATCVATARS